VKHTPEQRLQRLPQANLPHQREREHGGQQGAGGYDHKKQQGGTSS